MNISENLTIGVIGYGSWATALVKILSDNGNRIYWHIRNNDILESVRNEGINCKYLSDVELRKDIISVFCDINEVVSQCKVVLLATPAAYLKNFLENLETNLDGKFFISATKGTIPGENLTISEYLHTKYSIPYSKIGVISGPTHAEEVSRGKMTYITAACEKEEDYKLICNLISGKTMKVSYSSDIRGTELAAILKNIYAIAAGMASGLGYGDNFIAVLVSNCALEMRNFLNSFNKNGSTLHKNCLGDLLVTCYSTYSRNRRLGLLIGRGCTVKSALNEMTMVAEGYFAVDGIHHINKKAGVPMPVADMVFNVLYNKSNARREFRKMESLL